MPKASKPRDRAQRRLGYQDAKNAVATDGKTLILNFGQGLTLWVTSSGLKTWHCRVMRDGNRTTITLGHFPAMTVDEARAERMKIRTARDPAKERRDAKVEAAIADATTFRVMAERWVKFASVKAKWTPGTKALVEGRFANHVYPARLKSHRGTFGECPVAEITTDDVQDLIAELYEKTPTTAITAKQEVSRVLRFAWANDKVPFNVADKIKEYLPTRLPGDGRTNPHVKTIEDARRVLAAVEAREIKLTPWTRLAHRLVALTATRKMEALAARWEEFDLDAAIWTIPADRMKGKYGQRREHYVALAPQAIEIIKAAKRVRTKSEFVFPTIGRSRYASKTGHIGRGTINEAMQCCLRLAGLDAGLMVPHGWRSTFSTIMNEADDSMTFRVIDVMLAHKTFRDGAEEREMRKSSERHYNHATYRSKRHEIAARWADMLLDGAPSALALIGLEDAPASAPATAAKAPASNVIPLRRGRTAA